jgi:hypothetical protein
MRKPKGKLETPGFQVRRVPVTSRALVTIGPDHKFWKHQDPMAANAYWNTVDEDLVRCGGVIVRVRPPAIALPAWVQRLVEDLKRDGAAAVRVEWPARAAVVPEQGRGAAAPHEGVRDVVLRMVAQANTRDRAALSAAVEAALAAAGL